MSLSIEPAQPLFSFRHEAMATEFVCSLGAVDEVYARQAAQEAFRMIDDIECKLSLYRENSDVTRINLADAGAEVRISEEAAACLEVALLASALSSGRFNAFLGAEACRAKGNLPSFLARRSCVEDQLRGGTALVLDRGGRLVTKRRRKGVLDLGGVGKGFALDRAMRLLEDDWEIPIALLDSGGSTLLFRVAEGEAVPWRATHDGRPLAPLCREALSSSGLGFQETHIIDPDTGESRTEWRRAYVRVAEAGLADALSTGCLLMPAAEIERMASQISGCGVLVEPHAPSEAPVVFGRFLEAGA